MKQEKNNEMDLLLRRLGRRDDAGAPEDHLDADELNAYAENALPAAARARYTVHLAECSRCRSFVVQLSSAAGVVAATDSAAVPEPSGFRKFLAGLFTPMVLRYAAPALGLIVVAVIGFVVLRRNQMENFVAQNAAPEQQQVATPAPEATKSFNDSYGKDTPSQEERVQKQAKEQQPPPPPNTAPAVTSVEADVSKDKAAPKPEEQTAIASEPAPAKPEPSATPVEAAKNEVKVQAAAAPDSEKKLQAARREDSIGFQRSRRDEVNAPATSTGAARGIGGTGDFSTSTRTVAGRRFRKQGGVWIDTAHDSSKDAVTLTRGSEQYRALVADEPAIKTIADQLDGEIIVVWKGHTYRIR